MYFEEFKVFLGVVILIGVLYNPLTDTGNYDIITTFLKSIIFPLLPTIMELFQILSIKIL